MVAAARESIRGYHAFTDFADRVAEGLPTTPEEIREAVAGYEGIGADEVMLYRWSSEPGQVERLADAVS